MHKLSEPCGYQILAPALQIMENAVAAIMHSFLIVSTRVRAKQDAMWLQSRAQFEQDTWQLAARHMKQRCIGVHTIEMISW